MLLSVHLLILTAGSAGDVHPFVALGAAALRRGHAATLLANEAFEATVRGAGLDFVECGKADEFERVCANPDLWHPRKGLKIVLGDMASSSLAPTVDLLAAHLRADTVLVASTLGFAARIVSERDRVPLASVHLAPSVFRTMHRMPKFAGLPSMAHAPRFLKRFFWWLGDVTTDRFLAREVNRLRATFGAPPVKGIVMRWSHSPDLIVGLFPEWFGPRQPDWPAQLVQTGFPLFDDAARRPLSPELDAWMRSGDAPILFTAGSANVTADRFFAESVGACTRLRRRGLLVTKQRRSLPDALPDGVRHEAYVPFGAALPRCAALVGHGGIGTIAQGLAAGVPQLVTPMAFDQFDNASRLEELGVGQSLPMRRYRADRAAAALGRLLDDAAVAEACRHNRERFAPEAVERAVEQIEALGVRGLETAQRVRRNS